MNDRALIELAARAAGYTTDHSWNRKRLEMNPPVLAIVVHRDGVLANTGWNSLSDDGNAFRLAMALKMDISRGFRSGCPVVIAYVGQLFQAIPFQTEEEVPAAARRAITELAARIQQETEAAEEAINKAMP